MDNDSFAQLERRVAAAVELIADLRSERDDLTQKHAALTQSLHEWEQRSAGLQRELDETRRGSVPREEFEARKGQIERRVQSLLARFEELDQTEEAKG